MHPVLAMLLVRSLRAPRPRSKRSAFELDQQANHDGPKDSIQQYGPNCDVQPLGSHVGRVVISDLHDEQPNLASRHHRRAEQSGGPEASGEPRHINVYLAAASDQTPEREPNADNKLET